MCTCPLGGSLPAPQPERLETSCVMQHSRGLGADLRLPFGEGVAVPFVRCRWPRVGAQLRIGVCEYRCLPHAHGAVEAAAGQQLAVAGEHQHEYGVLGAGLDGRPDGLAGGRARRWVLVAWRVATGRPVAGFHSRTVPSPQPAASSLPSGLNATPYTPV